DVKITQRNKHINARTLVKQCGKRTEWRAFTCQISTFGCSYILAKRGDGTEIVNCFPFPQGFQGDLVFPLFESRKYPHTISKPVNAASQRVNVGTWLRFSSSHRNVL